MKGHDDNVIFFSGLANCHPGNSLNTSKSDSDSTIIGEANKLSPLANASFINADLRKINDLSLPKVDGIWCSFTAAYFPDFDKVFSNWIRLLKAGGWIALIEVNDLFNHSPLSKETRDVFADHYQKLFMERQYDFMMGSWLKAYAENYQFDVIKELEIIDPELAFTGQATGNAVAAWQDRFNRMTGLRRRLGENTTTLAPLRLTLLLLNQLARSAFHRVSLSLSILSHPRWTTTESPFE